MKFVTGRLKPTVEKNNLMGNFQVNNNIAPSSSVTQVITFFVDRFIPRGPKLERLSTADISVPVSY